MESWSGTRPRPALSAARRCTSTGAGLPCSVTCALAPALARSALRSGGIVALAAAYGDGEVPFKANGRNITRELLRFTRDLLVYGFTNKEVSELTGLGKNTVKRD